MDYVQSERNVKICHCPEHNGSPCGCYTQSIVLDGQRFFHGKRCPEHVGRGTQWPI